MKLTTGNLTSVADYSLHPLGNIYITIISYATPLSVEKIRIYCTKRVFSVCASIYAQSKYVLVPFAEAALIIHLMLAAEVQVRRTIFNTPPSRFNTNTMTISFMSKNLVFIPTHRKICDIDELYISLKSG